MITVPMTVSATNVTIPMTIGAAYEMAGVDDYHGEYVWTPTEETQTVLISGLRATQNITINPIPTNYGLITWNGSVLTVS